MRHGPSEPALRAFDAIHFVAAWLAVRFRIAVKPAEYSCRQLASAGALAGIGFMMSLFIAGEAFPAPADFAAAKIAIFIASLTAGLLGTAILWKRRAASDAAVDDNAVVATKG